MLIELAIDSRDWWVNRPDTNSNQQMVQGPAMGGAPNARRERGFEFAKYWNTRAHAHAVATRLVNSFSHSGNRSDGLAHVVGVQQEPGHQGNPISRRT